MSDERRRDQKAVEIASEARKEYFTANKRRWQLEDRIDRYTTELEKHPDSETAHLWRRFLAQDQLALDTLEL